MHIKTTFLKCLFFSIFSVWHKVLFLILKKIKNCNKWKLLYRIHLKITEYASKIDYLKNRNYIKVIDK